MNLDALHDWLLASNGDTTAELWHDLTVLRQSNPKPYAALPQTTLELVAGLQQLAAKGLARLDDGQWWWLQAAVKEPQPSLF